MIREFVSKEDRLKSRTGIKPRPFFFFAFILFMTILNGAFVLAQDSAGDETVLAEVERLRALKEQNPQAYQEHIQKKKEELKNRFETLKQDQPRYQAFMEKEGRFKQERLQRLQSQRPEAYQKFMSRRAERLEQMSQKNPERFNQVMNNHPRVQEWREKRKMARQNGEGPGRGQSQGAAPHPDLLPRGEKGTSERPFAGQNRQQFQERRFQNREGFQPVQNTNQNTPFNPGARPLQDSRPPMMNFGPQNNNQNNGSDKRPRFQEMRRGGSGELTGNGPGQRRERGGRKPLR